MKSPCSCCSVLTNRVDNTTITKMASRQSSRNTLPSFEEVLTGADSTFEPWRPQTFLEFLHTELNEENLLFFEEVEAFKAHKGVVSRAPEKSLLTFPESVRVDDSTYVKGLVETFVKEDSPRQVNISADQRTKLLGEVEKAVESQGYNPDMFLEAQHEVKKLMQQDSWPRFIKKVLTENISREDRMYRIKTGVLYFLLALLISGLFLGFLVPRYYFLLLFFPFSLAMDNFVTIRTKLCIKNAMNGTRDREGSVTTRVVISCPVVKASQKKRARRLFVLVQILSIACALFMFGLTYAIEAGQGKTLYG